MPNCCFLACHAGAANHMADFYESLSSTCEISVVASGPALKVFQNRDIPVIKQLDLEDLSSENEMELALAVAKQFSNVESILTDVGHKFNIALQSAMKENCPTVKRVAYYDNYESFVPGGYSQVASKVMSLANSVLFASSKLENATLLQNDGKEVKLGDQERVGLGYFPLKKSQTILHRRENEALEVRADFFNKHGIEDKGEQIIVYMGGNNQVYFENAFKAYVDFLDQASQSSNLSNIIFVLQQHPGAKVENKDATAFLELQSSNDQAPKLVVSQMSSNDTQVIADKILYYQTSMGPEFVLAKIPTVQIAHESYDDILIRNGLAPSICDSDSFLEEVLKVKLTDDESNRLQKSALEALGIKDGWPLILNKNLST